MLKRAIETRIDAYLKGKDHKIFFIWGPRRSGKTTILKKLSTLLSVPVFNFDLQSDTEKFIARREVLEGLVKEHKLILIDEVQNYPSATVVLKILHDEFAVKIIATGSSELRQKGSGEFDTLAGRFTDNYCLPLSVREIIENCNVLTYEEEIFTQELSVSLQIFGAYPEVYTRQDLSETERMDLLQNIFDTYVLKDIVKIYDLKNQKLAHDILTKIALQLGSEASLREIAGSLSANVSTVANYIEIFIKNYILIPLPSFKTNKRRAVSKNQKLYFYDPGIRNILVRDFRKLDLRPDKGGLFENFIISEVEKRRKNLGLKQNMYFYREYSGKEVDLVLEDYYKNYYCMEIKTAGKNRIKNVFPLKSKFAVIDSNNYLEKINRTFHK